MHLDASLVRVRVAGLGKDGSPAAPCSVTNTDLESSGPQDLEFLLLRQMKPLKWSARKIQVSEQATLISHLFLSDEAHHLL